MGDFFVLFFVNKKILSERVYNGAERGSWTLTGKLPTRPSSVHVYQFHHPSIIVRRDHIYMDCKWWLQEKMMICLGLHLMREIIDCV